MAEALQCEETDGVARGAGESGHNSGEAQGGVSGGGQHLCTGLKAEPELIRESTSHPGSWGALSSSTLLGHRLERSSARSGDSGLRGGGVCTLSWGSGEALEASF